MLLSIIAAPVLAESDAQANEPFISDDLLSSPVNYYERVSAKPVDAVSTQEWLLLGFTQHILGLQSALEHSLTSAQSVGIPEHSKAQVLHLFLVGATAARNGEFSKSIESLSEAKTLAEKLNARRLWVLATQELAFSEALTERFETSLLLLQQAYEQAQQTGGEFETALVEQTLGGVYSYIDNYAQASSNYQKALARYKALNFPTYISETLLGIATTHRHQQNWQDALVAYQDYGQSLAFQKGIGSDFYYLYGKGITLALSGRCMEADSVINAAVDAQGPRDYLGELYKKQAICAAQKGLVKEANQALNSAKEIIDTIPGLADTLWKAELIMIDSSVAEAAGDLPKALALFREFHETATRLQAKKASDSLLQLKSTLESERKDAQILRLQQQSELQSLELTATTAREQRSVLIIGCAVLMLIILAGIIFDQKRKAKLLFDLSVHDPLTNLYNRRHALSVVKRWLKQHQLKTQSFSIFIIDIDDFKLVNDTHGHAVGDKLLIAIANAATAAIRPSDVLARFGGEEFICVLPRISPNEAEHIAERIRHTVAQTEITLDNNQSVSRTVSIGIAHVHDDDVDPDVILERADAAMYRAKKSGRDRVHIG